MNPDASMAAGVLKPGTSILQPASGDGAIEV
jgi:hypothetical protein